MRFNFIIFLLLIILYPLKVFADAFVPDFNSMKNLQCEVVETVLENGNIVSKSNYHRLFRLEDLYKKIYLNKEIIDYVSVYNEEKIKFNLQSMTDDYISNSDIIIDRTSGDFSASGNITYDNPVFSPRQISAAGVCKIIN